MYRKVLVGVIIALSVIAMIAGGTYIIYRGMSKGIEDFRSGAENYQKDKPDDSGKNNGNAGNKPGNNDVNNADNSGNNTGDGNNATAAPKQDTSGNLFGDHGSYETDDSMSDEEASKYAEEEIIRIAHIPD